MFPYLRHLLCKLFGHKWYKWEPVGFCRRCGISNPNSKYKGTIKPWIHQDEEGLSIEWVTKDCRFGISIGKDISEGESGWYYISRCKHLLQGDGPLPRELFEKAVSDPNFLNPKEK